MSESTPPPPTPAPAAPPAPHEVTRILHAAGRGEPGASEQLLPLVYGELRRLAQGYMAAEKPGQTLQATALVHEAYLRLVGDGDVSWNSRAHFFGAAALAMRRILVDRARQKQRLRHGGDLHRVDLADVATLAAPEDDDHATDLVTLDACLNALAQYDRRKCDVVMLKYFAGLTNDEVAAALGVSSATVRNDWTFAKAWLLRAMSAAGAAPAERAP